MSQVPATIPAKNTEPTLAALLRALAYNQFPSRFHLALQLCIPFAVQFWIWGWHRTAGWLAAASAFGLWALCEQGLETDDPLLAGNVPKSRSRLFALRAARFVAGAAATALALGLLYEAIGQLTMKVFGCLGCAG